VIGAQRVGRTSADTRDRSTPKLARYDLVILGGGSAGLSAAQTAALLGVRVALIDRETLGGECLYTGCVPSKALLHVAGVAQHVRQAPSLGLTARLDPVDLGAVADHVQRVIDRVYVRDTPEQFETSGVEVLFGAAHFTGPRELSLNGHRIQARAFLICTGSHAAVPDLPGLVSLPHLTNDSVFDLRTLPATLTVVGGGPVGVELAQAFARLGAQVTLVQGAERLLPREEPAASEVLRRRLESEGVTVHLQARATQFAQRDQSKVVSVRRPDGSAFEVAGDEVLIALGRSPNGAGLGLEAANVAYAAASGITVDAFQRTSNPRIYAAGDVTGAPYFTHAAAQQARVAVRNAVTPFRRRLDLRVLPWATFTDPEVARVGLTEAQAHERYGADVRAYTVPFADVDRADTDGSPEGFVKLVATRTGELVGAHLIGLHAGEYVNELALAMQRRTKLGEIAATVHVYPTLALAIQQAAGRYSVGKTIRGPLPKLIRRYVRLFP